MSRIGKKPITLVSGVTVTPGDGSILVSGAKGTVNVPVSESVIVTVEKDQISVSAKEADGKTNLIGLVRSLLQNAVTGVSTGWTKQLEMVGVGYRSQTDGSELTVHVGFSHPVVIKAVPGIAFQVAENKIIISGHDKYVVGEVAASIHRIKPPEPYKEKGIRFAGEHVRKKIGKAGKAVGGAGAK